MIAASTATEITAIVVGFFALMVLVVVGRSIFRRDDPPSSGRFRVGVFVERDHEQENEPPPRTPPQ